MAIRHTIEFDHTETDIAQAIVALGKLAGKVTTPAPAAQPPAAQLTVVTPMQPVEKPARKPRADRGQSRGPHKPAEPNAAGASATAASTQAAATGNGSATVTDASKAVSAANSQSTVVDAPKAPQGAATTAHAAPNLFAPSTAAPAQAPVAAPAATTPAPAAAVPTPEQVQAAVEKLYGANPAIGGFDNCAALIQRFGVARHKDLQPEKRAEFIRRIDDILAGKYTATGVWSA